jgi:hypothetical protein
MTRRRLLILGAFVAAVIAAMGLSIRNGFAYDDIPAIAQNSRVIDPARWHTIVTSPYWLGTLWRPVTTALFAVQWRLGHGAPWLFHMVSLLGYLAVGVLLYTLMRRLAIGEVSAAAATALFLVHPIHVEVVANGVGQSELWVALALLGATLIYLDARSRRATTPSVVALLVVVILGMASKEQGFVVFALLLDAEWIAGPKGNPGAVVRLLVPVAAATALVFLFRTSILLSAAGEIPAAALQGQGLVGRTMTFLGVVPEYLRLLIWPMHLQAEYGPPGIPIGGPLQLRHLAGLAIVALCVAGFVAAYRRIPAAAFGLLWTAVTLAPLSNVLVPTGIVMAERAFFLPSIGVAITLGAILSAVAVRRAARGDRLPQVVIAVLVVWGIGCAIRSAMRVPTWSSQRRFYTDLTGDGPRAYLAWKTAGVYWEGAGDDSLAIADLHHAMELWPHDYEVNERLGQYLRADRRCDAAIPILTAGVVLNPDAPSLRAKAIECLITAHRWNDAERYARDAVQLGQSEFTSTIARIERLRAAADSAAKPSP